jgi:hypothetical protein
MWGVLQKDRSTLSLRGYNLGVTGSLGGALGGKECGWASLRGSWWGSSPVFWPS